jgi:carboxymethylenebutenolidase
VRRRRSTIAAASSRAFADDRPKVPTQLHFGEKDTGIPLTDVEIIRSKRPEERASHDRASADIARARSAELLAKHLKK